MFTALAGIVGENEEITVKITGVGKDGRMKVMVMPQAVKGSNLALAQPLAMAATPEELDCGFVGALTEFGASRTGLKEQVAVTTTIMAAAQKTEEGKATKALQGKSAAKPAAVATDAGDDGDGDDSDHDARAGSLDEGTSASSMAPTPPARPAPVPPASANDDLISLMG
jgi:PRTRC genetic system protein E